MSNETRHAKRRMVSAWKLRQGCSRCKVVPEDPADLHCDHLPGFVKKDNVSDLISQDYSAQVIWEEIDKCQVLCVDCHKEVTRERGKSTDAALDSLRKSLGLIKEEPAEVPTLKRLESLLEDALNLVYDELEAYHG